VNGLIFVGVYTVAEQWWAIYKKDTGKLVSTGSVVAGDDYLEENGLAKKKIPKQPDDKHVWDADKHELVEAPKPEQVEHDFSDVPTEALLEELKNRHA
jgi:hypothetical protein